MLNSVPGTLFEIVAGNRAIGILNEGNFSLANLSSLKAVKASKPPMINRASNFHSLKQSAVSWIPTLDGRSEKIQDSALLHGAVS